LIEVTDNGPGISNQILPLLFEPYFSTKKEGTGLGLAIAKRIISDHDGYIRASSQNGVKDVGACFTIELPINRSGEVMHGS
jgi:two-component system nitrogen regulation sensor histidine kinase NtrY